jgi:hypothetical protein
MRRERGCRTTQGHVPIDPDLLGSARKITEEFAKSFLGRVFGMNILMTRRQTLDGHYRGNVGGHLLLDVVEDLYQLYISARQVLKNNDKCAVIRCAA